MIYTVCTNRTRNQFEDTYKRAIEAGQSNLRATKLLSNWCFYAEFARSRGRGMIEAETGLPIGYMGVQCKFSKKNSMHCWLLEDAAYDFYQNNCKNCDERVSVGFPNIMSFVGPREQAAVFFHCFPSQAPLWWNRESEKGISRLSAGLPIPGYCLMSYSSPLARYLLLSFLVRRSQWPVQNPVSRSARFPGQGDCIFPSFESLNGPEVLSMCKYPSPP